MRLSICIALSGMDKGLTEKLSGISYPLRCGLFISLTVDDTRKGKAGCLFEITCK